MKASNFYAIAVLLVGLVMLASARPRFEVKELQMGRRILEVSFHINHRMLFKNSPILICAKRSAGLKNFGNLPLGENEIEVIK